MTQEIKDFGVLLFRQEGPFAEWTRAILATMLIASIGSALDPGVLYYHLFWIGLLPFQPKV
jgi:hypothetical protein